MLDLALSLVDRLIALVRQGHERDRKLYEDFFVTYIADLERLHQNYLESFARYRSTIEAATGPFRPDHQLVRQIERDIVFTEQLRSQVRALWQYRTDPAFGKLVFAAQAYLGEGEVAPMLLVNGMPRQLNAARSLTIAGLKDIFSSQVSDSQKSAEALALVDRVVSDLQGGYSLFVRCAAQTKRSLLDKRLS